METTFPYSYIENFIECLIKNKSFLTNEGISLDDLDKSISSIKNIKADKLEGTISGLDYNSKLILLHAYWLWYFPFGFKTGKEKLKELFGEQLCVKIGTEYVENENELAGMGGFGQLMHAEVQWILKNVFSQIKNAKDYSDFKEKFINNWKNKEDSVSSKNLLLHILDQKKYEPIAKTEHKKKIANSFPMLKDSEGIDDALCEIRNKLKMNGASFYDNRYSVFWKSDMSSPVKKLEYKKAMILYGPPGTSKTYTAFEMAKYLIVKYYLEKGGIDIADLNDKYLNNNDEEILKKDDLISYLQFHINYNYEDFIAGQSLKEGIVVTKKGFIFDVIEKATKNDNKGKPYVVILDEINRTDISRVFGELFTAIEKRGTDVTLMLPDPEDSSKNLILNVPENVYFIGTMNEIDFSLERVDFALRRRFVWELLDYSEDALENIITERLKAVTWDNSQLDNFCKACTALNKKVAERMDETYHIGHAFFAEIANIYLQLEDCDGDRWKKAKEILWQISIRPTLEAYCGTMDKSEKDKYLKDEFYKAFFGKEDMYA